MVAVAKTLTPEQARTRLEEIMISLPAEGSPQDHSQYLAGYIDSLHESNQISEEVREILYTEYTG